MEDVIKVLKQIVSALSQFGSVPRPVTVCITVFSGVFGFALIFVYAHLSRTQTILLAGAIGVMLLVTAGYYLLHSSRKKEPEGEFWAAPPASSSSASRPPRENVTASTSGSRPRPTAPLGYDARSVSPALPRSAPAGGMVGHSLSLLQLAEPLLQYICRLNRLARRGPTTKSGETTTFLARTAAGGSLPVRAAAFDEVVVRAEIKALIEDFHTRAAGDLHLSEQVRQIELPLIFFVDSMISESALPFAAHWNQNRLAYDRQELAGDEKFFDLLDETLKESGEAAAERLGIFYVCIGLGFTGIYFNQPELLRKTMLTIAPRIRHLVENDPAARICPETYEHVDTRNLVEPPGSRMALMGLVFGCCTVAVIVSYIVMYRQSSAHLNQSIEEVLRQDLAADIAK